MNDSMFLAVEIAIEDVISAGEIDVKRCKPAIIALKRLAKRIDDGEDKAPVVYPTFLKYLNALKLLPGDAKTVETPKESKLVAFKGAMKAAK